MSDVLNDNKPSDANLWAQLQFNDKTALNTLLSRWYRPLFYYSTKLTTNHALIQDEIQDLFLLVWEKRHSLPVVDSIRAYLFVSLRNNLLRRTKQNTTCTPLTDTDCTVDWLNPEQLYTQAEETESLQGRLTQLLERLPKRQREAIYLRYYENLSYDEIAVVMGLNRQVVANYLQHALHNLRHHWQDLSYLLILLTFHD